ncbi:MAG: hypothetical protein H7101_09895 [Deinococcales bacterium]|nr:hypothetical protein [Chitinophagaceae bacterium]
MLAVATCISLSTINAQTVTNYLTNTDGLSQPTGMATDLVGNIYIANANGKILKVTPTNVVSTLTTVTTAGFMLGLVYYNGFLFSGDYNTGNINKIDIATGSFTALASAASYSGLAVDATTGTLYGCSNNNSTVYKITQAGVVSTFASSIGTPFGMAVDNVGNIFVNNTSGSGILYKITSSGVVSTFFTGSGGVRAMYMDASNNFFLMNTSTHTLTKLNSAGTTNTSITSSIGSGVCYGVATQGTDLFVSNVTTNIVYKVANVILPLTLTTFTAQVQNSKSLLANN